MRARPLRTLALLLTLGCSDPQSQDDNPCPDGQAPASDGLCDFAVHPGECPAGTMPKVGTSGCVPVGWTSCPPGFEPAASGWGCEAILPASACSGATLAVPGDRECRPIGGCEAPFPPAGATLFVDDSYPASKLDGTHFKLIIDALEQASDGDVIAIEAGTYHESVVVKSRVRLVGRCAAKVVIDVLDNPYPGLQVNVEGVEASGLSIRNGKYGVTIFGGSLTLRDAVVSGHKEVGIAVDGEGAALVAQNVAIRDVATEAAFGGHGIDLQGGASARLTGVAIQRSTEAGIFVHGESSRVDASRALIADTRIRKTASGFGVYVDGGRAVLADLAILGSVAAGISVWEPTGLVQLRRGVVSGTVPDPKGEGGAGVVSRAGARLDLGECLIDSNAEVGVGVAHSEEGATAGSASIADCVVRATRPLASFWCSPGGVCQYLGRGVQAEHGSKLEVRRTAIVGNTELGLLAMGARSATVEDSLVAGTLQNKDGHYGRALAFQEATRGTIVGSAVVGAVEVGLDVDSDAAISFTSSLVRGVANNADGSVAGMGLLARWGGVLTVRGSMVERNAGVGAAFAGAAGTIEDSSLADNPVALQIQDGSALGSWSPGKAPGPNEVLVADSARFHSNQAKTGTGTMTLPPPVGGPAQE